MKKFLLGSVLLLLLAAAGGLYYVYSNLDRLVEQAIETAGSQAIGTPVTVDSVELDLAGGRASIFGFAIANPEGFSDNAVLSFQEATVVLDLANLSSQHVGIQSILARNPRVYFESQGRESNIDVLRQRLASTDPDAAAAPETPAGNPVRLSIGSVDVQQIEAVLAADVLQAPVQVTLADIHLENLSGTAPEIAQQMMAPLLRQIGSQVASSLLSLSAQDLKESAADFGRSALEKAEAAGDKLKEGFNSLLQGNQN